MKIERVDDKTVKCFLSNEELEEYEIDYKDFVLRSEKAKEVVREIIEQAEEEVGYKPPRFAFDLQIMMMPEQGLLLTFSEKEPAELGNGEQILECLRDMKQILQKTREKMGNPSDSSQPGGGTGQREQADPQNQESSKAADIKPEEAVFAFEKLGSVMGYANVIPANLRVHSALYQMEGVYYLYLQKGNASYERYSRACIQAMEFGNLYAADPDRILHLKEHGECMIAEQALKKLRAERKKK